MGFCSLYIFKRRMWENIIWFSTRGSVAAFWPMSSFFHIFQSLGYAPDFIQAVMKPLIKPIKQKGMTLT